MVVEQTAELLRWLLIGSGFLLMFSFVLMVADFWWKHSPSKRSEPERKLPPI